MYIYDITVLECNGSQVFLSNYKNKVLLIVNTATACGFTPQYTDLQNLPNVKPENIEKDILKLM